MISYKTKPGGGGRVLFYVVGFDSSAFAGCLRGGRPRRFDASVCAVGASAGFIAGAGSGKGVAADTVASAAGSTVALRREGRAVLLFGALVAELAEAFADLRPLLAFRI